ncbi:MAG: co-chaperone GroES [Candidatus Marinimicrobia bacterium]|nr:co-chaperone GroES [Candidatus Neomarinimicrobiota bacterium]
MKIKPLDDRVLIEIIPEENKTKSGIIIPDTAKEKPKIGKVVAVGTDEDLQELIKKNMKVLFGKYSGEEIKIDGKDHLLLQRSDILGIVEK